MKYPITVQKIEFKEGEFCKKPLFGGKCGDMVSIRPCADEHEKKTFLGVLLGELATNTYVKFDNDTGTLVIERHRYNSAIFIPDLNKIVFGYESWWGKIENEAQLKSITDYDIENVWYVKALKQLLEKPEQQPEQKHD